MEDEGRRQRNPASLPPTIMTIRFLTLPFVFCLAFCAQTLAGTVSLEPGRTHYNLNAFIDVLEDTGGKLSLADIRSEAGGAAFKPAGAGLSSFGFTESAYWFRFVIDNPSPKAHRMILVLRTAWLDTVHFYQPDAAGGFSERLFGDTLPFREREYAHPQFLVGLNIAPGKQTYYMRLTTVQSFMTPVELWEAEAFHENDRLWTGYFGMFYGIMLVMMLYNGFIWFSTRDRSYLYYCLYLTAFFLMNFSYNGFSFQYLWPESPRWSNWSHTPLIFLYQLLAVLFAMAFLETRSRLPRIHRVLKAFQSALLVTWLLVTAYGNEVIYNAASVYFVFFFTPLVAIVGITAWLSGYRAARFFVLASMTTLLGSLITALTASGFLPYTFATFHAIEFGITADVVLLALALADRINILHAQKEAAEKGVIEQKLRANALLKKAKKDLERTVRERTAELARARDKAERLARIDVLTGVSNRRYFEEVAAHEFARAKRYRQPLSAVMFDIDRFKQINDTYGHAAGDSVLKTIANLAKEAVREVDFVARIGGEEFAILLPEVSVEQALVTAERLRERVAERNLDYKGQKLAFTASFGVTQLDEADQDFETVLHRADQAMYRAKKLGRNQVALSCRL